MKGPRKPLPKRVLILLLLVGAAGFALSTKYGNRRWPSTAQWRQENLERSCKKHPDLEKCREVR